MPEANELMQVARQRAETTIDAALGELHAAAKEIGEKHEIPENIAGHSVSELLGRMAYIPSMARDLRRITGQELAKIELDKVMSGKSSKPKAAPTPVPAPKQAAAEPSKIPDAVPVGMDVSELSGVTVQAVKALKAAGLHTVGDVVTVPDEHMLKIDGIAEKSLQQIRGAITRASTKKA